MHNDPLLKIDDSEIPVVNEYKFDEKLSFIPHIKYLKKTNQPVPDNFCESLPTKSGELTVKL